MAMCFAHRPEKNPAWTRHHFNRLRGSLRRIHRLVRRRFGSYTPFVDLELTAVFKKVPEGYIAFVEELPGANTQGATLEEARANLHEAVRLVLEANRELAREDGSDGDVIREQIRVANG